MVGRSRIETRSVSKPCSNALHAASGDLGRDRVGDQPLMLLRQSVQQLLSLGVGQQLVQVAAHQFGQMGDQHAGQVNHRVALQSGLLALGFADPYRRQTEGRLLGLLALHLGDSRPPG